MPNIFKMTIDEIYDYIFQLKRQISEKETEITRLGAIINVYEDKFEERRASNERGDISR